MPFGPDERPRRKVVDAAPADPKRRLHWAARGASPNASLLRARGVAGELHSDAGSEQLLLTLRAARFCQTNNYCLESLVSKLCSSPQAPSGEAPTPQKACLKGFWRLE